MEVGPDNLLNWISYSILVVDELEIELVRNYAISDALITYSNAVASASFPIYNPTDYVFIIGFTTTFFDSTTSWTAAYDNTAASTQLPFEAQKGAVTFFGMSVMSCSDPGEYLDRVGKTCFTSRNSCPAASWFQALTVQTGSIIRKIIVHESNTLIATLEENKIQFYKYDQGIEQFAADI